jgi:hypothetical protein
MKTARYLLAGDGRTDAVVAGGRRCSAGGWLSMGWREGGGRGGKVLGAKNILGEI